MVGKNESRIAEYIKNQLKQDEMGEQLTIRRPADVIAKADGHVVKNIKILIALDVLQ